MKTETEQRLLIVDDDPVFCESLAGAMRRRGFDVSTALNGGQAMQVLQNSPPLFALIDLYIGEDSGLFLVEQAAKVMPPIRIVVLTGYASIATAVEAVKLGATHYLSKPAEVDDIMVALTHPDSGDVSLPLTAQQRSIKKIEWEYIQDTLHKYQGNISATARALKMHRRTLQRKLKKHPVRG
jgi:two-component system response regulator RegA